jgi:hypothetical protein
MANKQTRVDLKRDGNNSDLSYQEHETDAPILPVAQIERLTKIDPNALSWVMEQTKLEATARREQSARINGFIFAEHLISQIFALIIGLGGIAAGSYVAVSGQPAAGGTIATASITGLAVVFLKGRKG